MKTYRTICTLFFGVMIFLFFGLAYPHHLHYQEQFQLFLFDSTYAWDVVKLPGGVADLLGRFCTQFFLYAWVGAFIIALLLTAVQIITSRMADFGKLYGLSFVPSFLLWIFLLDENALLGGVWALLITLLACWLFGKISNKWLKHILYIAAIPTLYWMAGPVCMLFFLLPIAKKQQPIWHYSRFIIIVLMLILSSHYLPVHQGSLWLGIHYHRNPAENVPLLWAAMLSILILILSARALSKWTKETKSTAMPLVSFAVVALVMGCFVWQRCNFKAEKVMQYDFMVCHQQWNRIIEAINKEKPNNQIGVTVQNLALAMKGQLLQRMFDYNQNGLLGLVPTVESDATSPMPTAEAFYQLGMINVAQRTVFEAQEAILDFQKSARCYKRLAQTNLINGNYEVARKYLTALQKTLFYKEWADETMKLLGNEKAIAKHPEYGHLRKMAYTKDFYFSDQTTPQMLQDLYTSNTENQLAYQYMMAAFILTGDRESYYHFAPKN